MSASRNTLHIVTPNWIRSDFLDCCISCLLPIFRQASSVCCIIANRCEWMIACHNTSSTQTCSNLNNCSPANSLSHFHVTQVIICIIILWLFYLFKKKNVWWMYRRPNKTSRERSSASTPSSQCCDWMIRWSRIPEVLGHLPKGVFHSFWDKSSEFLTVGQTYTGVTGIRWREGTPVTLGECATVSANRRVSFCHFAKTDNLHN